MMRSSLNGATIEISRPGCRCILSLLRPNRLNVLTIHAEVEGGCCASMFSEFLNKALHMGITVIPLGKIIEHFPPKKCSRITKRTFPGRQGWLSVQKEG